MLHWILKFSMERKKDHFLYDFVLWLMNYSNVRTMISELQYFWDFASYHKIYLEMY